MSKLDGLIFPLPFFLVASIASAASVAGVACGSVLVETDATTETTSDDGSGSGASAETTSTECDDSEGDPAGCATTTTDPPAPTEWWRHVGGADSDVVHDLAVAADGDVVVAGAFRGTADFGDGPTTALIPGDAFVARYAPNGALRWLNHIGSSLTPSDNVRATGVAVSGDGSVLLTGTFEGMIDPGTGPLEGAGDDTFVVRYAADGKPLWGRRIDGQGSARVGKIATDGQGNALLAGMQGGDLFVAKLAAAGGEELWFHTLGAVYNGLSDLSPVYDVATDPAGDFYITGSFLGAAELGGAVLQSASGTDIFLARYRGSDGGHVWSERHGGMASVIPGGDEAVSLAVNEKSIVLCGSVVGPADLGGGVLGGPANIRTAFLARYETAGGAHLWSRTLDSLWASRVALSGDTVLVLGLLPPDDYEKHLLGRFALGNGADAGLEVVPGSGELAIAADGHVMLAIDFTSQVTAGSVIFNSAGQKDFLVGPFTAP